MCIAAKNTSSLSATVSYLAVKSLFLTKEHRASCSCQNIRLRCQLLVFTIIWYLTSLYHQNCHLCAKTHCESSLPSASCHFQPSCLTGSILQRHGCIHQRCDCCSHRQHLQQHLHSHGSTDCKPALVRASLPPQE